MTQACIAERERWDAVLSAVPSIRTFVVVWHAVVLVAENEEGVPNERLLGGLNGRFIADVGPVWGVGTTPLLVRDLTGFLAWFGELRVPAHEEGDDVLLDTEALPATFADGNGNRRPVRVERGILRPLSDTTALCISGAGAARRALHAIAAGLATFLRETLGWVDADECAAALDAAAWSRPFASWPSPIHAINTLFQLVVAHPDTAPTHLLEDIASVATACAAVAASNGLVLLNRM